MNERIDMEVYTCGVDEPHIYVFIAEIQHIGDNYLVLSHEGKISAEKLNSKLRLNTYSKDRALECMHRLLEDMEVYGYAPSENGLNLYIPGFKNKPYEVFQDVKKCDIQDEQPRRLTL